MRIIHTLDESTQTGSREQPQRKTVDQALWM